MRFDPDQGISAAQLVNTWPEHEIADVIYQYGEERQSRRIARYLVQHRPFTTTAELAAAVERASGGRRGQRIHPATRTFQALRIAVNEELADHPELVNDDAHNRGWMIKIEASDLSPLDDLMDAAAYGEHVG